MEIDHRVGLRPQAASTADVYTGRSLFPSDQHWLVWYKAQNMENDGMSCFRWSVFFVSFQYADVLVYLERNNCFL